MRNSIVAALAGGLLLAAGTTGAMARGNGYIPAPVYYGVPSALNVLSALAAAPVAYAAAPVGYVVETQCAWRHFVNGYGRVVSRRVCYPVQAW